MRRVLSLGATLIIGATLAIVVTDLWNNAAIEHEIENLRAYAAEHELNFSMTEDDFEDDDDNDEDFDEGEAEAVGLGIRFFDFYDIPAPSLN